jgi:hypothetical protein
MADELSVELYSSAELADVFALTHGGSSYIVAIDHTYELAGGKSGHPVEKTVWHFWRDEAAREGMAMRKLPEGSIPLPTAQAIAGLAFKDSLAAIVEANNVTAAWLMLWDLTAGGIANLATAAPRSVPLDLDTAQVAQIHLPAGADWSTAYLPCPLWLFHASLSVAPETGNIVAALNTADAHAVVFQYVPGEAAARSIAFVPNVLEPVFLRAEGKSLLFYRKPTADWSVYFHDVKISGEYGPVALPLEVGELNKAGGIEEPKRLDVGNVFLYAILSGADGRIALATVTGSKQKPELQLRVSTNGAGEFSLPRMVPLRQVPFRISMTRDKQGILMALGFLGEGGGFRVETLYLKNE